MTGRVCEQISLALLLGGLHLLVDGIKCFMHKVCKLEKYQLVVFLLDQLIHITILWIIANSYKIMVDGRWIIGIPESIINAISGNLVIVIAFLFCGKPVSIIVSKVFDMIPKTIQEAQDNDKSKVDGREVIKIGSWIGILEREIILILGLMGEYGAIGFVIAAKSLARHSQFNIPAFAEKYLIGTLLSAFIALICIVGCLVR